MKLLLSLVLLAATVGAMLLALGVCIVLPGCSGSFASAKGAATAVESLSHKDACTAKAEVVIDLSQNALEEPCEITAWRLSEFAKLDEDCKAFFGPDGPSAVELCNGTP